MTKRDLKKELPDFFRAPSGRFERVELPPMDYLAVRGAGDPNRSPAYGEAVETLFGAAYALKFLSKKAGSDYVVPPLEGLWWADDPADFVARRKDSWRWIMMILVPPFVEPGFVGQAIAQAAEKAAPAADRLETMRLEEGTCLQTLHVGSYDAEGPVLAHLHDSLMPEEGWTFNGHHHEVYLSDPRRVQPEKLKTILRQPVRRIG